VDTATASEGDGSAIGKAIEERKAPKAKERQKEADAAGGEHWKKGGYGKKKDPLAKINRKGVRRGRIPSVNNGKDAPIPKPPSLSG
jgi:hypothetical protein